MVLGVLSFVAFCMVLDFLLLYRIAVISNDPLFQYFCSFFTENDGVYGAEETGFYCGQQIVDMLLPTVL